MRQIPGKLFNLTDDVVDIEPDDAIRWHYIQTMAGDCTDGYSGISGVGIKRANQLLEDNGCSWQTVQDAFIDKGMTVADALMNARLARILQHTDYDFNKQEPILWSPSNANVRADTGARLQATTA